jgi:hypothetical protein
VAWASRRAASFEQTFRGDSSSAESVADGVGGGPQPAAGARLQSWAEDVVSRAPRRIQPVWGGAGSHGIEVMPRTQARATSNTQGAPQSAQ